MIRSGLHRHILLRIPTPPLPSLIPNSPIPNKTLLQPASNPKQPTLLDCIQRRIPLLRGDRHDIISPNGAHALPRGTDDGLDHAVGHAEIWKVRRRSPDHGGAGPQQLGHVLLNGHGQSHVALADKVGGGHVVPGLVRHGRREDGSGRVAMLSDPEGALLRRHVRVEGFRLRAWPAIVALLPLIPVETVVVVPVPPPQSSSKGKGVGVGGKHRMLSKGGGRRPSCP